MLERRLTQRRTDEPRRLRRIECQVDALDARPEQVATCERWAVQVGVLTRFRGIATLTALGVIAEIGNFARFGHPRELAW